MLPLQISEALAVAECVIVNLVVNQPYVIGVYIYVHLVWKIIVKLLVPLKL